MELGWDHGTEEITYGIGIDDDLFRCHCYSFSLRAQVCLYPIKYIVSVIQTKSILAGKSAMTRVSGDGGESGMVLAGVIMASPLPAICPSPRAEIDTRTDMPLVMPTEQDNYLHR